MDRAPARFEVVEQPDGETVVCIAGELDITKVPELADRVETALAAGPRRMVVDVSQVSFADSAAISLWLQSTTSRATARRPPARASRCGPG